MKKGVFVGALVTLLCVPSYAYAKSGAIEFTGNRSVNVGDEFKVNMIIDNIVDAEEGIVGFGGYISFDNNVLEIVDAKGVNEYFDMFRNSNNNKIAGINMTLENGINSRTTVYEITFRGINEGNTTVTMTSAELVDRKAEDLDVNVNGLNVTVNTVKPVVEEVKTEEIVEVKPVKTVNKVEKTQTQEEVIQETIENKEELVKEKPVKKAVKTTKKEKNLLKIVSRFFKKIFKKVA